MKSLSYLGLQRFFLEGISKIKSWKAGRILYVSRIGEQMVRCVERKNTSKAKHWSRVWETCQVDLLVLESGRRVEKE